jgi:hypothetical protein
MTDERRIIHERPQVHEKPQHLRLLEDRLVAFSALSVELLADPASSSEEINAVLVLARRWGLDDLARQAQERLASP